MQTARKHDLSPVQRLETAVTYFDLYFLWLTLTCTKWFWERKKLQNSNWNVSYMYCGAAFSHNADKKLNKVPIRRKFALSQVLFRNIWW